MHIELDPNRQYKLSDETKARLDAINNNQIDNSDIPELSDEWFSRARRGREMRVPTKHQISLRVDDDVYSGSPRHRNILRESSKGHRIFHELKAPCYL